MPEPKVMHTQVEKKRVKVESIKINYKKDGEIEGELKNVNIECYMRFDYGESMSLRNVSIVLDRC